MAQTAASKLGGNKAGHMKGQLSSCSEVKRLLTYLKDDLKVHVTEQECYPLITDQSEPLERMTAALRRTRQEEPNTTEDLG